jgi:uncharacterized membrane protein YccC
MIALWGFLRSKAGQWALIALFVAGVAFALVMYGRRDERSRRAMQDLATYVATRKRIDDADVSKGDETADDAWLADAARRLRDDKRK